MDTDLYDAVTNDEVDVLKELEGKLKEVEGKLSVVDQRTPADSTVLHLACHYGSINCVIEILNVHESLLLKLDSRGETALHLAAREGHYDVVQALISAANSSLLRPDHYLQNTSSTMIQILIRSTNVELDTALHLAVRYNHKYVVQLLLTKDPTHLHPQNVFNETPLYLACIRGDTQIIRTILDNCESPISGGPEGRTALHALVSYMVDASLDDCRSESVKLLLQKDKDLVSVTDNYGWTVFHYVAYYNLYALVEDLVAADKSVAYLADKEYKRTPLHVAAYQGSVLAFRRLVKYIPDGLEILDAKGRNILHIAVEQGQNMLLKYVVLYNCKELNKLLIQRDAEGNTPLHLIAKLGCYVEELTNLRTIDWEVLNHDNLTPLDLLTQGRNLNEYLSGHLRVRKQLFIVKARDHLYLSCTLKDPNHEQIDLENPSKFSEQKNQKRYEEYKGYINTPMVVAALIATVALTAGFAMPGGFDGNEGPTQGSAILLRKAAFQTFIVTDAIALLCSLSSLFLYFQTPFITDSKILVKLVLASTLLNFFSFPAITLAFITGTYAVLAHSTGLAITVCAIPCLFFVLVFFVIRYLSD